MKRKFGSSRCPGKGDLASENGSERFCVQIVLRDRGRDAPTRKTAAERVAALKQRLGIFGAGNYTTNLPDQEHKALGMKS